MMTVMDPIAIYGSVVATLSIGWQVFTWYHDKPKLRIDLRADMVVDKSNRFSFLDQKNEYGHNEKGIHIEIVNVGKTPTTVRYIGIQPYKRNFLKNNKHSFAFPCPSFSIETSPLPAVLNPGEIWSGFFPDQTQLFNLSKEFDLVVEISHSFSKKQTMKKLKFSQTGCQDGKHN